MKRIRYFKITLLASLLMISSITGCTGTKDEGKAGQDARFPDYKSSGTSLSRKGFTHGINTAEAQSTLPNDVTFKRFAPFFAHPYTPDTMGALDVFFYGETGTDFKVVRASGDWIGVNTTYGLSWVPQWYSTQEAGAIITQKPTEIILNPSAKLALNPGSAVTLSRQQWQSLAPEGKLISILRWQDWRGVVIVPQQSYRDYRVVHPALLWVRDSEVDSKRQLEGKLAESKLPSSMIRAIADIVLTSGASTQDVYSLLGEPAFKEDSPSLNDMGGKLRRGIDWRYEQMDPMLTVTFTSALKLERLTWKPIITSHEELNVMRDQYPISRYRMQMQDLVSSRQLEWSWRNQGDLAYTYLRYVTPEVLLIYGDDGGFSGMHNDSSLYALSRTNGKKLWQINAGFGGSFTALDPGKEYVAVLTPYSKDNKVYDYHLRRLRIADGKMIWEKYLSQNQEGDSLSQMVGVGEQIILYSSPGTGEPLALSGLDARTGKVLWNKKFKNAPRIMNLGEESFVLLKEQENLVALDPVNGSEVWTIEGKQAASGEEPYEDYYFDRMPQPQKAFGSADKQRWFLLGKERLLVEMKTGEVVCRYIPQLGSRDTIRGWSGSLILIERQTSILRSESGSYETFLLDTATGKELWRKKGRSSGVVFEGNMVYLFLDGPVTALEVESGKLLWQVPFSEKAMTEGYMNMQGQLIYLLENNQMIISSDQDLLLLDKTNGKIRYRLGDAVVDFPEARDILTRTGLVNSVGQELYLGSGNGKFSKINLPLP